MSPWVWVPLALYLCAGALVALAYTALDQGTRGSGPATELWDLLRFPWIMLIWLPYIMWVVVRYALALLLPVRWSNRLWRGGSPDRMV